MARSIVLPLYPHTSDEEIAEILSELKRIGLDDAVVVHAHVPADELTTPELDVAIGMLTQRLYLRENDPEVELVRTARVKLEATRDARVRTGFADPELDALVPVADPDVVPEAEADLSVVLAPIDQDGARVDAPALSLDLVRELRLVREEQTDEVGLERYAIRRPDRFRDHAEEIGHVRAIELLRVASVPIAGRDGWRRTADGREWYSTEYLGATS